MIRPAEISDAAQIAAIYNGYVAASDATFDTEPVSVLCLRRLRESRGLLPRPRVEAKSRLRPHPRNHRVCRPRLRRAGNWRDSCPRPCGGVPPQGSPRARCVHNRRERAERKASRKAGLCESLALPQCGRKIRAHARRRGFRASFVALPKSAVPFGDKKKDGRRNVRPKIIQITERMRFELTVGV